MSPTNSRLSGPHDSATAGEAAFAARDRLLQRIGENANLPALGSSVARVVQIASSDDEAVRNLAYFVLSDVALTQKILRISNTVLYRGYSGTPITTISKAIFLLGFDTVKTIALAMMLVDGMPGASAMNVRAELTHALCASVIGREMARRSHFKDAEEAAIAALFKNMGRLLVAAHDHVLYGEIAALIEAGSHAPNQASMQVLGCSFDLLAESVLREWQIPDTIVAALNPLPPGALHPVKTRQEWMQQVASFSTAATALISRAAAGGTDAAGKALLDRFGAALNLDREALDKLFATVARETQALSHQIYPPRAAIAESEPEADHLAAADEEAAEQGLPAELLMTMIEDGSALPADSRHPSGKPVNACAQLMAGVQDVTEMMASGRCKANDLIVLVLETIYRSMGFRFATICLKDIKTNQFRARMSLGEKNTDRQDGFLFPVASSRNLFHLAMENDADLMISDASAAKIRDLIPAWHRALLPDARSFIILPLVVQKKPFGFFYADRVTPAPEGVPPDETALIRILKTQVLAALASRN